MTGDSKILGKITGVLYAHKSVRIEFEGKHHWVELKSNPALFRLCAMNTNRCAIIRGRMTWDDYTNALTAIDSVRRLSIIRSA